MTGITLYINSSSLKNIIIQRINNEIPGTITWRKHRLSLFPGRFTVDSVVVFAPDNARPCATIPVMSFSFSLSGLIRKKIYVNKILLDSPSVRLEVDVKGNLNIAEAFVSSTIKDSSSDSMQLLPFFPLKITKVSVKNGNFKFANSGNGVSIVLDDVNIQGGVNLFAQSAGVDIVIAGCSLSDKGKNYNLDTIRCALALQTNGIDTADVFIKTGNSSVIIRGSVANILQNPEFAMVLQPDLMVADIAPVIGVDSIIDGRMSGNIRLNGVLNDPRMDVSLVCTGVRAGEFALDSIRCNARLKERIAAIDSLSMYTSSGYLNCFGTVDAQKVFPDGFINSQNVSADDIIYDVALKGDRINLAEFFAGAPQIKGMCSFDGVLKGTGVDPRFAEASLKANAVIHSPSVKGVLKQNAITVLAGMHLKNNRLIIDTISAESDDISLRAYGYYDLEHNKTDVTLDADELSIEPIASLFSLPEMKGSARLHSQITGSLPVPFITAGVAVKNYAFNTIKIDTAFLLAHLDSTGTIDISILNIAASKSFVSASADLEIFKPKTFMLNENPVLITRSLKGTIFLEDFFDSTYGKVDIGAKVTTGLHKGLGDIIISGAGLSYRGVVCDSAYLDLTLKQDTVYLQTGKLFINSDDVIFADGSVTRDSLRYNFRVNADALSLSFLNTILHDTGMIGNVSFNASGMGKRGEFSAQGVAQANNFSIKNSVPGDIKIDFSLTNDSISAQGVFGGAFKGRYLFKERIVNAAITLNKTDIAAYIAIAGYPALKGTASGSISANGPVDRLDRMGITADISELILVTAKGRRLLETKNMAGSYNNGTFNVQPVDLVVLENGRIAVSGTGTIQGAYDFSVTGTVPFTIIETFVPEIINSNGLLKLQVAIRGGKNGPQIDGQVSVDSLGFTVPGLNQELRAVRGTIRISGQKVQITDLRGRLDEGFFACTGDLFLKDFIPEKYSLNLQTNHLPLNIDDKAGFVVNAELSFDGNRQKASAKGHIDLVEGVYYEDFDNVSFFRDALTKKKEIAPAQKKSGGSYWSELTCDLYVSSQKYFIIDNNIAHLDIKPDLHFTGKLLEPTVNGRAETVSGTILYQQNTFQVTRGIIDYFNAYYYTPAIDIEAETKIRDWTIYLKIEGTPPDNLQLVLHAEPPLSDQNIVSLLLLRKTTDEITGAKGYYALSLEQVMDILSGPVSENLKKRTGIDILTIKTESSGSVEGTNLSVNLGKNLSKRVTTFYTLENEKGAINQKATVEYKLLDNIMLRTFNDTEGKFGGEAKLEFEFR